MHIRYTEAIEQSDEELEAVERQQRGRREFLHVRLLRLLKSGQARTLTEAAHELGYSLPQVTRWWERYCRQGLRALVQPAVHPGRPSRMTPAALERVQAAMERGEIATIEQARQYVATHDQIVYQSQHGMAVILHKYHIRKKTGRRRHRKASAPAQETFKKNLLT